MHTHSVRTINIVKYKPMKMALSKHRIKQQQMLHMRYEHANAENADQCGQ